MQQLLKQHAVAIEVNNREEAKDKAVNNGMKAVNVWELYHQLFLNLWAQQYQGFLEGQRTIQDKEAKTKGNFCYQCYYCSSTSFNMLTTKCWRNQSSSSSKCRCYIYLPQQQLYFSTLPLFHSMKSKNIKIKPSSNLSWCMNLVWECGWNEMPSSTSSRLFCLCYFFVCSGFQL